MTQTLNQFVQAPVKGQPDLSRNIRTVSAVVYASESAALVPGQPVKRLDATGGVPVVSACTANTDTVFGFVQYSGINASFAAGKSVEISTGFDDMIYLEAGEAMVVGTKVMIQVTGSKVVTATAGKPISGYTYDKAAADGDLIRVSLACPAYFVA